MNRPRLSVAVSCGIGPSRNEAMTPPIPSWSSAARSSATFAGEPWSSPAPRRFERLDVHHEGLSLSRQVNARRVARGPAYHDRVRFGVGPRPQHRDLQLPEPAVMREFAAGPRLKHDRLGFIEARLRLVMVDAEALVIIDVIGAAAAEPDDEPPFRQIVE